MKCRTCGVEGHDSQGNKELCLVAVVSRCERVELQKDEAVAEVAELQSALEDCLALLKAVEEQSGPERMKQFRVDPYGTISDAGTRLLLSRRITQNPDGNPRVPNRTL
jgi:hypothetical protein